jgi:multidrug efflux pump subunit AcrB
VKIEMVPGTTIQQTEEVADQVADIINQQPETDAALARIREGDGFVFITLKPDRERTSIEFERELGPVLQKIPDARVSFLAQGFGGPSSGRDITVMLAGSDPVLLNNTAARVVEEMKGLKDVSAPRVSADLQRPEIIIRPRYQLAADLGVTTTALSQTIRIATLGDIDQNSAKFSLSDRQIPIRVMLPEESRRDLSTIENLPVPTTKGGSVPLSRVADIDFGAGPTTIQRENQQRRVFIGADLAEGIAYGDAIKKINELPTLKNLPLGVVNNPAGGDEIIAELVTNFITAVIAGVFLVFGVLVLLYRRFVSPLVNMSSLLLAPLGGIFLIWITGNVLSIPVFIGTLMLLGIVGKNSILLIDFALEEMDRGVRKFDAIVDAGRKRAQPIVMTTVAMVAGMVPTAMSLGGDGAWRAPMGVVVIGGLIMSTILTLALVPAGFSLAHDIEHKLGRFFGKKVLSDDYRSQSAGQPGSVGVQPAE